MDEKTMVSDALVGINGELKMFGDMIPQTENKELKEKIEEFWKKAVEENPNLYNGTDYTIEKIEENKNEIKMIATRTNYAHYLYDERVGIKENYRCGSY